MFGATWQMRKRLLCRRRHRLVGQGRGPRRSRRRQRRQFRHEVRLAVPHRLSPGRRRAAGSAAAATSATTTASAGPAAHADRRRAVQSVHGRSGRDVQGDGDCAGFDWVRDYLSVERADRHVCQRGTAEHRVDGAEHSGTVPVTVTGTCPTDKLSASDYGQHSGRRTSGEDHHVRGCLLRLRSFLVDRRRAAHSGAGGRGDESRPDAARPD